MPDWGQMGIWKDRMKLGVPLIAADIIRTHISGTKQGRGGFKIYTGVIVTTLG
jgi:hypothetical protein